MNGDKSIITKKLCTLWSVNISKMHFQQQACFQLRSWAFAITGVVIPLIWASKESPDIKLLLHVIAILIMGLILNKDLNWHGYFFKYRDRARLIEKAIIAGEGIDIDKAIENYFILEKESKEKIPNFELLKSVFKKGNFFLLRTDYIELYMIFFLLISLIATAVVT